MEKQSGFPPSPRKVNRRQASQKFKFLTGGRFREKLPNPHFAGGCFNPGGLCALIVRAGATGRRVPNSRSSPPTATFGFSKITQQREVPSALFSRRSNPAGPRLLTAALPRNRGVLCCRIRQPK